MQLAFGAGALWGNRTDMTGSGIGPDQFGILQDVQIDWDSWERPRVFDWLAEEGIEEDEARRVFNLGIGLCAVVPDPPAGALVIGRLA